MKQNGIIKKVFLMSRDIHSNLRSIMDQNVFTISRGSIKGKFPIIIKLYKQIKIPLLPGILYQGCSEMLTGSYVPNYFFCKKETIFAVGK